MLSGDRGRDVDPHWLVADGLGGDLGEAAGALVDAVGCEVAVVEAAYEHEVAGGVDAECAGRADGGLLAEGGRAVGLSGADGAMLRGRVTDADLGLVAGSVEVDVEVLEALMGSGFIPVVAPLALDAGDGGRLLNVNADTVAGALASALGASHLVFLTDVDGVLDEGRLLSRVPVARAEALISSGIVKGGMIPKMQACIDARRAGVEPHIINATTPHALLACVDGASPGTTVV